MFAIGRYDDVEFLILVELVSSCSSRPASLLFSTRARGGLLSSSRRREEARIERPARSVYEAMHVYREPAPIVAVAPRQRRPPFVRIISIWLCGEAVGLDLSLLVYVILGPLLFLVMMVPFTINGLGVREAFFVAFLGRFGVDPDAAFAGFLFYAVTMATSIRRSDPAGAAPGLRSAPRSRRRSAR